MTCVIISSQESGKQEIRGLVDREWLIGGICFVWEEAEAHDVEIVDYH